MQVSQPDPRVQIDLLLRSLPESGREEEEVIAKVKQIAIILGGDPTLKNDTALFDRVCVAIKALPDETIREKCRTVLAAPVTLTIIEHEIENYGEGLWDMIREKGIKRLVIERKGTSIVYEGRVLQQLVDKRPKIAALTEMCTLKFSDESTIVETKANLLLCGDTLETVLVPHLSHGTIVFRDVERVQIEGILKEIKTGKMVLTKEERLSVFDFLGYKTIIPKGAFGPAEWEKCGIKIAEVPPVPEVILNRANPENYLVVLIPANLGFSELIKQSGIKIDKMWDTLEAEYGKKGEDRPYWVAIEKELMPHSGGEDTRKEQLDMASQDGKHQAPSILEAVACNIASMKTTGMGLWGMWGNTLFPMLTCCREDSLGEKKLSDKLRFFVGCSSFGFAVDGICGGSGRVGVARLLRES